jgi:hypothetical protein
VSAFTVVLISFIIGAMSGFGACLYMAPHRKALRWRKRLFKLTTKRVLKGQPLPPLDYALKGSGTLSEDYRLHDDYHKRKPARS